MRLRGRREAAEDREGAGQCDLALTQGRTYGTVPILTALFLSCLSEYAGGGACRFEVEA